MAETAYYYPEPYWRMHEGSWVKSLLLCFDRIGVLMPAYMRGRESLADPVLAEPLVDSGHLLLIEPETFVDAEMTERVAEAMVELITAGAFDDADARDGFAELSMSRMGSYGDSDLFEMIREELERRDLARETEDGVSVPLHPLVRRVYLLLLAQFARHAGARHGLDLHPATNFRGAGAALAQVLESDGAPSKGHVVSFDLNAIGVDLDSVPLNEVLDYRAQHEEEYRRYMRDLRRFLGEVSMVEADERQALYDERAAELQEGAADLRRKISDAWRSPLKTGGFAIGIGGAGWSAITGDPVGVLLGLAGLGVGLYSLLSDSDQGSAYSYLFSVRSDLPYVM